MIHTPSIALCSLLSLLGIWVLVFRLYRGLAIASFRQELFILRDRLFDDAARGPVPFDAPAYCLLRRTMNGFIRYGHRVTLAQLLALAVLARDGAGPPLPFMERWRGATKGLDPAVVERLDGYCLRMNDLVVRHLIVGSPEVVLTLVIPLGFVAMFFAARDYSKALLRRVRHLFRVPIDGIDYAAAGFDMWEADRLRLVEVA